MPPNRNGPAEVIGNIATFDDVDDFNGYAPNPITFSDVTFTGYSLSMSVTYFTVAADGTWGTADSGGAMTNAKRIRVVVNHALIGGVVLDCITGASY